MKRYLLVPAILVMLAAWGRADFRAGLEAYQRGDYAAAMSEWLVLAEQGDANAQYNVGLLHARGLGVPQDFGKAAEWYEKAARQGVAAAQYNLGVLHANGQGMPQNVTEARRWFLKAAEQGVPEAQDSLGYFFGAGQGVPKDYAEARRWYRKAAERGIASAQYNLGVMYDLGQGVERNYEEALRWYRMAADQGYPAAMCNIGILYYNAQGLKRDLVESYAWIRRASDAGDPRAPQLLRILEDRMKPSNVRRAEELAASWKAAGPRSTGEVEGLFLRPPRAGTGTADRAAEAAPAAAHSPISEPATTDTGAPAGSAPGAETPASPAGTTAASAPTQPIPHPGSAAPAAASTATATATSAPPDPAAAHSPISEPATTDTGARAGSTPGAETPASPASTTAASAPTQPIPHPGSAAPAPASTATATATSAPPDPAPAQPRPHDGSAATATATSAPPGPALDPGSAAPAAAAPASPASVSSPDRERDNPAPAQPRPRNGSVAPATATPAPTQPAADPGSAAPAAAAPASPASASSPDRERFNPAPAQPRPHNGSAAPATATPAPTQPAADPGSAAPAAAAPASPASASSPDRERFNPAPAQPEPDSGSAAPTAAPSIISSSKAPIPAPGRPAIPGPAGAPGDVRSTWTGVERVVAIGDVHGDFEQFVLALESAGLVDGGGNWTGGKTHLVQTGGVLGRGPDSRKALDLLMRLEIQARAAGGAVHALIGSDEAMSLYGDFRYVTPGEFAAFAAGAAGSVPESAYGPGATAGPERPEPDSSTWIPRRPPGFAEYGQAFSPSGAYGSWILGLNTALRIDDTLFVHAGLGPKYAGWELDRINEVVRRELSDPRHLRGGAVLDADGPLWYRGLAEGDETQLAPLVDRVLATQGVRRIVIGHTGADRAVMPRFGGKVLLVDVGLSRAAGGGALACLVIENGRPWALHRGQKLELPRDSGPDLLRYLREAAALDPKPSPLVARIATLESGAAAPPAPVPSETGRR